jgi:tetratricopeptide (TPR) repeat protein
MRRMLCSGMIGLLLLGAPALAHAAADRGAQARQSYERGETLRRAGKYAEAIEAYRRSLQMVPEHPVAFDRLRESYNRVYDAAKMRAVLEGAVGTGATEFISWNLLGVLYGRERRWDEALKAFARSLQAEPRAADALVNRGWVLLELRRHDDAVAAFEAALAIQPRAARAHAGIGSAVVEARGDYAEGVKRYLAAVKLDPENSALLNDLGWLSYKMNRYPEAIAALEKAARRDPENPMIQTNLGLAYHKAGRVEDAIATLQHALAVNPEYTLALYGLGKAYESRGQYAEAIEAYRRAWRQSGNDLYLLLWVQAYMASHGGAVFLVLLAFLIVGGVIGLRAFRGRRAPATSEG